MKKARDRSTGNRPPPSMAGTADGASACRATRPGRRRAFRLVAALAVPGLLLAIAEGALRLAGFGYEPAFFIRHPAAPPDVLVENQRFAWRFFPPTLARHPEPIVVAPRKPPGVYRIIVFGESAAEGDPAPAYSFARVLQVLLQAQHPTVRFEVINVAFTAINSHVIRAIAQDCARLESDLWLVYMGNNEVIGPYGPSTVFNERIASRLIIRTVAALKRLRLGQAVAALSERWRRSEDAARGWGGMTMFATRQLRPDDPRLAGVYARFRRNLNDIVRIGRRAGAQVMLSTVAGNLRDWPPFASLHRADLTTEQTAAWSAAYEAGVAAEASGTYALAIQEYERAARIDDGFADLHFRWARCCLAAGQPEKARTHFALARDRDALRVRTDSTLNDVIRATAQDWSAAGVGLLDAEDCFARRSADGIPGGEWFYEHVHFTFAGNYLLARAWAEAIGRVLPPALRAVTTPRPPWLSEAECAARLAYTLNMQYEIADILRRRFAEPVYRGQLDAAARDGRQQQQLAELRAQNKPAARQRAVQLCRQAIAAAPDDWVLRFLLARALGGVDDLAGAAAAWREVAQRVPHDARSYFEQATLAVQLGTPDAAIGHFRRALEVNPAHAESEEGLALVYAQQGRSPEALRHARRALARDPTRSQASALVRQLAPGRR